MKRKQQIKIAIVEDNKYYNVLLTKYVNTICSTSFFPEFEFEVKSYFSAHDCITELDENLDVLLLDYYLFNDEEIDELTGSDVLAEAKKHCPHCKIIMVSSLTSRSKIMELMKEGLYAYVDKNVNSRDRIGSVLQKFLNDHRLSA